MQCTKFRKLSFLYCLVGTTNPVDSTELYAKKLKEYYDTRFLSVNYFNFLLYTPAQITVYRNLIDCIYMTDLVNNETSCGCHVGLNIPLSLAQPYCGEVA